MRILSSLPTVKNNVKILAVFVCYLHSLLETVESVEKPEATLAQSGMYRWWTNLGSAGSSTNPESRSSLEKLTNLVDSFPMVLCFSLQPV